MNTKSIRTQMMMILAIAVGIPGCHAFRHDKTSVSINEENISIILDELETMPNWLSLSEQEFNQAANDIERATEKIAAFGSQDIRAAFQMYLGEDEQVDYWSEPTKVVLKRRAKVMIVSKFLFNLPARIKHGGRHYDALVGLEGIWLHKPIGELLNDAIDGKPHTGFPRWPWFENDTGEWVLGDPFFGRSIGSFLAKHPDKYDPLASFDYYEMHFARRKIVH